MLSPTITADPSPFVEPRFHGGDPKPEPWWKRWITVGKLGASVVFVAAIVGTAYMLGGKPEPVSPSPPPKKEPPKKVVSKVKPGGIPVLKPANDEMAREVSRRLNGILRGAATDDWTTIEMEIKSLKSGLGSPQHGDRKLARALNSDGLTALRENDYQKAIQYFTSAIAADPGDVEVRNNLGYAFLRNKNLVEAERNIRLTLNIAPDRGGAWANMAEVFAENDNSIAARAALKVAIRLSTNRQRTLDYLTRAQDESPSEKFAAVIRQVLPGIDAIPSAPLQ